MKTYIKEIIWIIVIILLIPIVQFLFFGENGLNMSYRFETSINNTYVIAENIHIIILNGSLVFFCIYLIRMLIGKSNNIIANSVLILSNIALIWIATLFNLTLYSSSEVFTGSFWIIYKIILGFIHLTLSVILLYCIYKVYLKKQTI